MDLGFAGLIEKIEERFGKFITNVLLLALLFVVLAWALETLASTYVSGTELFDGSGRDAILGLVKLALVHVTLIALTCLVSYSIFKRLQTRVINRIRRVGEDTTDGMRKVGKETAEEMRKCEEDTKKRMEQMKDEFISRIRSYKNRD